MAELRKFKFELKGTMPLLMSNNSVTASDELEAWRKDPANKTLSKPGDDRSPGWTWQTRLYTDGKQIAIPSDNLSAALRKAAGQIILQKQKSFKELSQSGMVITDEFLTFTTEGKTIPCDALAKVRNKEFAEQEELVGKLGFRLFIKRARIGQAQHIRVRPRFDKWEASGELMVSEDAIKLSVLQQMFEIAGRGGLCDWRPSSKTPGPYGMFESKLVEIG